MKKPRPRARVRGPSTLRAEIAPSTLPGASIPLPLSVEARPIPSQLRSAARPPNFRLAPTRLIGAEKSQIKWFHQARPWRLRATPCCCSRGSDSFPTSIQRARMSGIPPAIPMSGDVPGPFNVWIPGCAREIERSRGAATQFSRRHVTVTGRASRISISVVSCDCERIERR